jgi:hypothetical protein
VQLQHREADEFWNLDMELAAVTTVLAQAASDGDGRFRFPVARARPHRLRVEAGGFAAATVVACTGGSEVVVELTQGASIEGVVRCEGKPLADVPIRIAVQGANVELVAGRTDPAGMFRFAGLPPAAAFVQVRSPLHEEKWQSVDIRPDAVHHVDVDVAAGVSLRGRVIDAVTRDPLAGAEVTDSWTFTRIVRSGADGRFVLPGLTDEHGCVIHARARGYATFTANLTGTLGNEAEVALVRGAEVIGRCVTDDGAPVVSAYVALGASFRHGGAGGVHTDWIRAVLGVDGRFVASGLRPDQHYWLYAGCRDLGTRVYALPRRLAAGERLDVGDVNLRPAGGIEGCVVDERGEPWSDTEVSLRGSNADSQRLLASRAAEEVAQFMTTRSRTDQRGVFRFTDLAAGTYELSGKPRNHSSLGRLKVEVVDGVVQNDVRLVVARGFTIAGTLRYGDGRRLGGEAADVMLIATPERGNHATTRPAIGGRFSLAGLAEGPHTVALLRGPKGWSLSPRAGIAADTQDLDLVLEPCSFVRGRVLGTDGKPVKARVTAAQAGARMSMNDTTDGEGRFEIEVPSTFRGRVTARDLRIDFVQDQIDGVEAGRADLELKLKEPRLR